jgi:hypothetical protein
MKISKPDNSLKYFLIAINKVMGAHTRCENGNKAKKND